MDIIQMAQEALKAYPVSSPEVKFIRHNENMTFFVIDGNTRKPYLLRIHKPITANLLGIQHTYDGLNAEIRLLQEIGSKTDILVQRPVCNHLGEYVSEHGSREAENDVCSTLLEWIDGNTLDVEEENAKAGIRELGRQIGKLHRFTKTFRTGENFIRPAYDSKSLDTILEKLRYGLEINLFETYYFEMLEQVFIKIRGQFQELNRMKDSWGIIHADLQPSNILKTSQGIALIDFCLSGLGHYFFDLALAASNLKPDQRDVLLEGYREVQPFSFENLHYLDSFILIAIFGCYAFHISNPDRQKWIREKLPIKCDSLCKPYLEGKELFYIV